MSLAFKSASLLDSRFTVPKRSSKCRVEKAACSEPSQIVTASVPRES